jgi:hypothetical protein
MTKTLKAAIGILLFITLAIGASAVVTKANKEKSEPSVLLEAKHSLPATAAIEPDWIPSTRVINAQPLERNPSVHYEPSNKEIWCDNETAIFCTTMRTTKPTETIQKLIAAIPQGKASTYVIRVSVTPIEDSPVAQ